MNLIISLLPILLPFLLLVVLKTSAKVGMSISFIILAVFAFFLWDMEIITLLSSIIQGIHKAAGILIILFGAIFLMNILKMNGAINRINIGFNNLTKDMRIQVIVIAFLFGGLIEGVAGFGTPAVVVAPLLVALGFRPIVAATVALISNSVPVPFAAVGTPVQIGLGNISTSPEFFNSIANYITSIEFLAGAFMPTIVVIVLLLLNKEKSTKRDFLEILPWTLFIGYSYAIIAFITARILGYEFVTIITVLLMLIISTITIRLGFLVPKNIWRKEYVNIDVVEKSNMSLIKAWSPYILVISLLIVSRVIEPVKIIFQTFIDLSINNILGVSGINSSLQLLYSPGFILILAAVLSVLIQNANWSNLKTAGTTSFSNVKGAALALIPTLAMVQIFSNSGINTADLASMPVYLATTLGKSLNSVWILLAPFVGELGSFIAGSATVSALTFSPIQYQIALEYGMNTDLILALGLMGGAAGNMICVHNVVSVSTVVNIEGQEGSIIKKTIIPAIIYGLLMGISAIILF